MSIGIDLSGWWDSSRIWRNAAAALATLCVALLVAAVISRDPPEFSCIPVIAVVRDGEHRPIWEIRLASAAHQIAAASLLTEAAPTGYVHQLWLSAANAGHPRRLGVLPQSGSKRIAVSPQTVRLLAGAGEVFVTLEPPRGPAGPGPSSPAIFRGRLHSPG